MAIRRRRRGDDNLKWDVLVLRARKRYGSRRAVPNGVAPLRGFVRPDLSEKEVARRMAAYNLIGVAVCDEDGRLLGAITVDDVLDRILPSGWRRTEAT